jgi:hypothetical protein
MFDLNNIKLEEFDMYTFDTEILLNKNMLESGFTVGGRMNYNNEILLKYYKIEYNDKKVIEKNIIFQYETKDGVIYVLKNISKELITREMEKVEVDNI